MEVEHGEKLRGREREREKEKVRGEGRQSKEKWPKWGILSRDVFIRLVFLASSFFFFLMLYEILANNKFIR